MPKINVYLPDDLATAVRESGIAVSPICQRALADAVRAVERGRRTVAALRNPGFDPTTVPQIGVGIERVMTARLRAALELAALLAGETAMIETRHLLLGILDEGENLAVHLLRSLDVDLEDLRVLLLRNEDPEAATTGSAGPGTEELVQWHRLSDAARFALASMAEAAVEMGHNYLGCEHLLIGLVDVENSRAGTILRAAHVDKAAVAGSVHGALAGYSHARQQAAPRADGDALTEILRRLDTLEQRLSER